MGSRIPRDIEEFQRGYPDQGNNPKYRSNLDFYSNAAPMRPDDLTYEEFLNQYERNWNELEQNHAYIQWLFPIPEQGLNYRARPLQKHEQQAMAADPVILARIERSYSTMLAFYGIEFNSGHLRLSVGYEPHLNNLSHHAHNLLRITRILKHISLFPSLQVHAAPLVLFFCALHEEGLLDLSPNRMHGSSLDDFWSGCFRDEEERAMVKAYISQRGAFSKNSTKDRRKREDKGSGGLRPERMEQGEGGEKMLKITLHVADPAKGRNASPAGGVDEKGGKGDGGKRKRGRDSGGSSDGSSKKSSSTAATPDALAASDSVLGHSNSPFGPASTAAAAPTAPLRGFARWEAWYRQHRFIAQAVSTSGTSGDTRLESDGIAAKHSIQDEMPEVQPSSQATLVDGLDNLKAEKAE